MKRTILFWLMTSLLLTGILVPAPMQAQEVSSVPSAVELSEPPTVIATNEVSSYSVPSPGLFYQNSMVCPAGPGPKVAVADGSGVDSPDTTEGATPFTMYRTTVRAEGARLIQYRTDPSVDPACAPYTLYSNIVADANFVYWVDATGLVKLPVGANYYDAPTLVNAAYNFKLPVELADAGGSLIAVSNLPVGGDIIPTGGSYIEYVDKTTGDYSIVYRAGTPEAPLNMGFRNVKTDGKYIYVVDKDRTLARFDPSGESIPKTVGAQVSDYFPQGEITFCPTIECTTTDYVYYAQGNTIRRNNMLANTDEPVQNLPSGAEVQSLLVSSFLGFSDLFYFRSTFESNGGFGGTYTYSLYRASTVPFSAPDLLYFYISADATPVSPGNMTTDGNWLFWTEGPFQDGRTLKRLPNDVDPLPKVDMSITGMEITQGVQNDANSVRLVKGRETYVRAFIRGDADIPGATMRLYVTYNGIEHGPYRPINGTHLTAKIAPSRNQVDDSFLFVLPWEASNQDSVSLRAYLNPYRVPPEPNYDNNQWISPPYALSPGRAIDLIFVEANYCLQQALPNDCPGYFVNDTETQADYMRRAYPIPEGGINYRVWTINGGALLGNYVTQRVQTCLDMDASLRSLCASDWVNAKIGTMRTNAGNGINAATLTYGLISDSSKYKGALNGAFPRGQAGTDRIGSGPAGSSIISTTTAIIYSDYGYYSGHEIAHMFGRQHPSPNSDDPATTVDGMGNPIIEGCGHSRSDNAYPYALARIGPGDGTIRGFDRAAPAPEVIHARACWMM